MFVFLEALHSLFLAPEPNRIVGVMNKLFRPRDIGLDDFSIDQDLDF